MTPLHSGFLGQFDSSFRRHLLDYADRISELDVDVLMLMARKAACLFDCLERVGYFHHDSIWTSNRSLELDRSWLKGKRVALVDDTLFSGTTLYRTQSDLEQVGVADITTHVFCASRQYWSSRLVQPQPPFLKLNEADMTGFCTLEVNALSVFPRPYNVDYPLFDEIEIETADLLNAFATLGWRAVDNTSALQHQNDVRSITLTPGQSALEEFEAHLGWAVGSFSQLLKVRLYAYSPNSESQSHCRALPIVALDPLRLNQLDSLWHTLAETFLAETEGFRPELFASRKSRLHLLQYLIAAELGAFWMAQLQVLMQKRVQFNIDQRQVQFAFSPDVADWVMGFSRRSPAMWMAGAPRIRSVPTPISRGLKGESKYRGTDGIGVQARLTEPFLEELWPKEVKARELAKAHGPAVFGDPEFRDIMNRLEIGFSLPELRQWLSDLADKLDPADVVSRFLDIAVDRGVIVPVTVEDENVIYRAFRHGENLRFTLSEKRLLCVLLETLEKKAGTKGLLRIWTEKGIALYVRSAYAQGHLHEWQTGAGDRLGLRWSLHGVVAQVDPRDELYKVDHDKAVTGILKADGYLSEEEGRIHVIAAPDPEAGLVPGAEAHARMVGRALGAALQTDGRKGPLLSTRDLTLIASCLKPVDLVSAIAAELEIFRAGWDVWNNRMSTAVSRGDVGGQLTQVADSFRASGVWLALNSAHFKIKGFHHREQWQAIRRVKKELEDQYADVWDQMFPVITDEEGAVTSPDVKRVVVRLVNLAERARHFCQLMLLGLYFGAGATSAELRLDSAPEYLSDSEPSVKLRRVQEWIESSLADLRLYLSEEEFTYFRSLHESLSLPGKLDSEWRGILKLALEQLQNVRTRTISALDFVNAVVKHDNQIQSWTSFEHFLFVEYAANGNGRFVRRRINEAFQSVASKANTKFPKKVLIEQVPSEEKLWPNAFVYAARTKFGPSWLAEVASSVLERAASEARLRLVFLTGTPIDEVLVRSSEKGTYEGRLLRERIHALRSRHEAHQPNNEIVLYEVGDLNVATQILQLTKNLPITVHPRPARDTVIQVPTKRTYSFTALSFRPQSRTFGGRPMQDRVDVGIITVVPHEMKALLLEMSSIRPPQETELGGRYFQIGSFRAVKGLHSVAATMATDQGNRSVILAYESLVQNFAPHLVVLLGIAGGIHKDVRLCDVVVADQILYYDRRKVTAESSLHRVEAYRMDVRLKDLMNRYFYKRDDPAVLTSVPDAPYRDFRVFLGPLGSGEAVLASERAPERLWLRMLNDKCLAVETEAAGFAQAFYEDGRSRDSRASAALVIRGISDAADSTKDDRVRLVAARHGAIFLKDFLGEIPPVRVMTR
jgi:nucleoside phosphorylase